MASTWAPPTPSTSGATSLDRFFHVTERGSTVRTELIAGAATWLTMAYIIFLNPIILGTIPDRLGNFVSGGSAFDAGKVAAVTALVAGALTLLMGVYANYPFALAAGLGLNAFVTFTLVGTFKLTWPQAMGVIVWEGLMITLLVLTKFRELVLNAIPLDLKKAIGVGIGAFIAFIGLVNAGIVIHPKAGSPIVTLQPDLRHLNFLVFFIGLAITIALVSRKVRGALLGSIVLTTIIASIINVGWGHSKIFLAQGPNVAKVSEGKLPGINRVLLVDSLAAAAGGAASASSNTTYIESAAGVSEGGRTGLTSVVVAVLFFAALFLSSLAGTIPTEATAPVLLMVGYFMMTIVKDINWSDPAIGIPALLIILVQPLTFSITNGVGAGFIAYTVIQLLRGDGWRDLAWSVSAIGQGRWREMGQRAWKLHPLMLVVAGIFGWYFWRGLLP